MANWRAPARPPKYLTGFYVALSFGGMIGGLFAGLIAPNVFSWVAEYPILVVLAALCRPPGERAFAALEPLVLAALAVLAVALIAPLRSAAGQVFDWLEEHRVYVVGAVAVFGMLLALGLNADRWKLACPGDAGAGADPRLSGRRRAGRNRAQLLRRPQDRGHAARPVSRADARHHDPRRREIPERRRHAGSGPARTDHLLPQGRRHRSGDHRDPRAQGRAASRGGDRPWLRHADLRVRAGRDLEVLRDRSVDGRYRARPEIFHLHQELRTGSEAGDRRRAADLRPRARWHLRSDHRRRLFVGRDPDPSRHQERR